MYEVLLEEIRTHRPELLDESFTVAEIYQNLMPYRTHRDRIGIEMNGDYEHALLRLLAGEGGYVTLESDAARQRLREELESLHPDTGVYRNFAACEVRLNDEGMPSRAGGGGEGEEDRGAVGGIAGAVEEADESSGPDRPSSSNGSGTARIVDEPGEEVQEPEGAVGERRSEGPGAEDAEAAEAGDVAASGRPLDLEGPEEDEDEKPRAEADPDATCPWCREQLPERDDLEFCPFCGSRVDLVPCPECGTELEAGWLFCVACGTQVQD